MNNKRLYDLIKESALLEEEISKVYLHFSKLFKDDAEFWLQLYIEEKNHAEIFNAFLVDELPLILFPEEILDSDVERLRFSKKAISEEMKHFLSKYKKKIDAYNYAIQLEDLSGESTFQKAMEKDSNAEALLLIQKINKEDYNHKIRINYLIEKHKQLQKN